jgi:PrtD family type I secretion system ABC transporter
MLAVPLYLLQVFDRVLTSRSFDTLWVLTLITAIALLAYGLLEAMRRLMLSRMGVLLETRLGAPVLKLAIHAQPASGGASASGVSDLQTVRSYLGGQALLPLLDAPWSIVFLAVIFLLHPALGWLALAAFFLLAGFALINEKLTRESLTQGRKSSAGSARQAEQAIENSEVILAMGMGSAIVGRWRHAVDQALAWIETGTRRSQVLSSVSKVLRQLVQVVVLATGAYLAIEGAISPGAMIAASILVTRALAPVDQLIGTWGQTIGARAAWRRLREAHWPEESTAPSTKLPVPEGRLIAEGLTYVHPGQDKPMLQGINLDLQPGESLGLIGPTGSGKTTLARCLLGVLTPRLGSVRLDGVSLSDWDPEDRGRYVGYLPQDLELFPGTVAENIARFTDATDEAIVAAAQLAGAHDMILTLAKGYDTPVGPRGVTLSGGQRQRLALARALIGNVRLVVLDEPNANQDRMGEEALLAALRHLKSQAVTSIIIAHRPAIIQYVDKILVLRDGRVAQYGPRDQVLAALSAPPQAAGAPKAAS